MARTITEQERTTAAGMLAKARVAMAQIDGYDQERVDRLCRAVAWATANIETATKLANMSVDESGMGGRAPTRRAKVMGILRDALRQKSMGVIEEIQEKGIVKYGKPAGVIAAHSIPATYMGKDGRQYVVVSAAGGGFLRDPTSDAVIAYALPKAK